MYYIILILINFFFVPVIPTVIIVAKNKSQTKFSSFLKIVPIYLISVVGVLLVSNLFVRLVWFTIGLNWSVYTLAYTAISTILSVICALLASNLKITFVKKEALKEDYETNKEQKD